MLLAPSAPLALDQPSLGPVPDGVPLAVAGVPSQPVRDAAFALLAPPAAPGAGDFDANAGTATALAGQKPGDVWNSLPSGGSSGLPSVRSPAELLDVMWANDDGKAAALDQLFAALA